MKSTKGVVAIVVGLVLLATAGPIVLTGSLEETVDIWTKLLGFFPDPATMIVMVIAYVVVSAFAVMTFLRLVGVGKKKKRMARPEAEERVRKATEAFFHAIKEGSGIAVEEGKLDGGGEPFTAKRVEELRRRIEEVAWSILRDSYIIEEG